MISEGRLARLLSFVRSARMKLAQYYSEENDDAAQVHLQGVKDALMNAEAQAMQLDKPLDAMEVKVDEISI